MNQRLQFSAMVPAALLAGLLLAGCPGTLADKECFVQEGRADKILATSCTDASCHNAKDHAFGLDLETPGVSGRYKGVTSSTCNGVYLVPGKPEESLLFTKLSDPPPCGSRMPLGKSELYPEDIETLRVWIAGLDGSCSNAVSTTSGSGGGGTSGAAGTGGTGGTGSGGMSGAAGMGGSGGSTSGSGGSGGM